MIQRNIELGYGTVTKEAMQDRNLTVFSKCIYAYLCSYAGGTDKAWPSYSKMEYDLQITQKTIRKYINELVDNDYLEVDRFRYSKSQQYANNEYTILK